MKNMIAMFFFVLVTSAVASQEGSLRGSRGDHNAPNQNGPASARTEESLRGSRGDHNAPNQSGPTSTRTVVEMRPNDFCTHGCNSTDVETFSRACKCANGILAECDNTNGSVKNSKICKCGKRTCTFQTPYCDKRRSSGRCNYPKCDNTNGKRKNKKDCKCGRTKCTDKKPFCFAEEDEGFGKCTKRRECGNTDGTSKNIRKCTCGWSQCTRKKPYCDKILDYGTCQRVPKCDNTNGKRKNKKDCKCGRTKCTDKKPFCFAEQNEGYGKCTRRRECKNTDGTKRNGRACKCGSTLCAKNKPFCYKERNGGKCTTTRVAKCSNTNRTERNTEPCMCGTDQICSRSHDPYCDKSVNEGRGECYEFLTEREYEQNKNWWQKSFESFCNRECNVDPSTASCKCVNGILAECDNTDASAENSKICKCGKETCGDQKKYCDKRGGDGTCERFPTNRAAA